MLKFKIPNRLQLAMCIIVLTAFLTFLYLKADKQSKVYIISGGGGVGKSTIIDLLKSKGFQTLPEAFTHVYKEAKEQDKLQDVWGDPLKRNSILVDTQIAWLKALDKSKIAFADRGLIEILFFANYLNVPITPEAAKLAQRPCCSNTVFFLDPLPEQYFENNGIREGREEALKIHDFLKSKYLESGYTIIEVPFDTPEGRVCFILECITKGK